MNVLAYIETADGKLKKSALEIISYSAAIASQTGGQVTAIALGDVQADELAKAGRYGAAKVLHANNDKLKQFVSQAYASVVAEAAKTTQADVVILSNSFSGKAMAPRLAIKLQAGIADGAVALPDTAGGFKIKKTAFSGKAFADVELTSKVKIVTLVPNSFKVAENAATGAVEVFNPQISDSDFAVTVKEVVKASDKISLPEAEIVVSGGRGLKGPENWGMVEELAGLLGAATACSKPVSDANWRPHSEHVGQTGLAISPNLYIAIGISGAIQHLAGVSSSKTIVVINKDPEAPFFKAADYGIVGDAFEVVPKLIEEVKKFKAANS
ncbi:MAG: electron transfer flavoprotein subunit alpha/FixB family protein [Bacteroidetes bacterium]|jgi:electron transfer flavoprotein alpha subunit|nr:electron transfer flavoprotein subunit alpha/FixB family protein [Bacteroidota bacterium]